MKIHCIGIGGIGISALAQYYRYHRHEVTGSDLITSEITDLLEKKGIKIFVGNKPEYVKDDLDLIVYSPAVPKSNPELIRAQELGIIVKSYPEALGQLTREYYTIAIAGSHGKSTTTAMIGLVMAAAGLDPTVVVGTKLSQFGGSNFRAGKSKYLVIEACEYDSSFVQYFPKITIITNIDKEHLDYFKTFKNVISEFKNFALKLPKDGFLVINGDDKFIPLFTRAKFLVKKYSLRQKEAKKIKKILQIPGKHNISNALAVLTVARVLNISDDVSFNVLSQYQGSWRRFEVKEGSARGKEITIISDYAHHPTEIKATLKAAREKYRSQKIWCIFQPHQYQRTYYLFSDFVKVFKKVKIENIIITDIYDVAGREENEINQKVNSEKLVKKINKKNVFYMPLTNAEYFIKSNIKEGEVLIIMGAGDVYKLADRF